MTKADALRPSAQDLERARQRLLGGFKPDNRPIQRCRKGSYRDASPKTYRRP